MSKPKQVYRVTTTTYPHRKSTIDYPDYSTALVAVNQVADYCTSWRVELVTIYRDGREKHQYVLGQRDE